MLLPVKSSAFDKKSRNATLLTTAGIEYCLVSEMTDVPEEWSRLLRKLEGVEISAIV